MNWLIRFWTIIRSYFFHFLPVSRPRFWMYVLWPYLIGLGSTGLFSSIDQIIWWWSFVSILFLVYFTFPANLLIYGINDIFDRQTDLLNPKKTWYETQLDPSYYQWLRISIAIVNLPLLLFVILPNWESYIALIIFWLASIWYSAPPLRAKAKPVVDTIVSALIYTMPWLIWYYVWWWDNVSWMAIGAAIVWSMWMHAYSAIPDIQADTDAGIDTVATLYGRKWTLWFGRICVLLAIMLALPTLWVWSIILWSVYLIMIIRSFTHDISKLYRWFPWINTIVWFVLLVYIVIGK